MKERNDIERAYEAAIEAAATALFDALDVKPELSAEELRIRVQRVAEMLDEVLDQPLGVKP